MGKNLIQQRRGKGNPRYLAPSHRYLVDVSYGQWDGEVEGVVVDIVDDPGRYAPLARIRLSNGETWYNIAWMGASTGDTVRLNSGENREGNVVRLKHLPEGTRIYNIEIHPNDGGKLCRTPGSSAVILSKTSAKCIIQLPSKKTKELSLECRATIGIPAGDGINEKPFMKAGNKWKAMKARNKLYPIVTGRSMNALDHPFGGSNLGRKKTVSRHSPPGSKVGSIAARRTGRRKR